MSAFIRFCARFLSFVALVAAVVAAAVDAVRFAATSVVSLLPLRSVLVAVGGDVAGAHVPDALLAQPAVPVLLVFSLVFWMAGYRRPKPFAPFRAADI
ncbi:hypothetical protein NOF55_00925 [Rhizobiaceae bacterium BDR2-2]|uniref:Uncharacterized protein n=1 Tax=Ectorhizobium quercum TaxID=2965071 RepID=A0AAE3MWG8_9HYPH|nr:hypothetical protein [Ectorhizobium quercum]MCX8995666.1 hypothetical protein [Ectorhizobium quercum]